MDVSKVQLANGEVLVDLTEDSVTEETLAEGATAHDASGKQITGTMKSGGGASVQSDWNQTDSSAADFIKNKPFGEIPAVIVEEQTISFNNGIGSVNTNDSPAIGDSVTVEYNGTVYICQVQDYFGYPAIGNVEAFDEIGDSGEPFFGIWMDATYLEMYTFDGQDAVVKISGNSVKTLPEKYYKKQTMIYTDGTYLYKDGTLSTKITATELLTLMLNSPLSILYSGILMFAISGYISEGVGIAICYNGSQLYPIYTAEYTPET